MFVSAGDSEVFGRVESGGSGSFARSSINNLNAGFTHIAMTFKDSIVKLYFDGVLQDSVDTGVTNTQSSQDTLSVGRLGGDENDTVDGVIDDVRVYDRALSQPEIEVLANLTETSTVTVEDTL
jgi:hypothetical protein